MSENKTKNNMKYFVGSFSTGKDSTLAIYKAMCEGMVPLGLVITYNADADKAWFHGLPAHILERLSHSLGITIRLIKTSGEDYENNFACKLSEFRLAGADTCVFGDIDIDEHYRWGADRCYEAGLTPYYPLWHKERRDVVMEFLDSGFTAYITAVDTWYMNQAYLGKKLTKELIEQMEAEHVDVCGENGEYHTMVTDGPTFYYPFTWEFGEPVLDGRYAKLPLL